MEEIEMVRVFLASGIVALTSLAALAQQDPIATRKSLMKANDDEAKIAAAMIKGESPFDLAAAHKVFDTFEDSAKKMGTLVPSESQTGGQTTADPKIWENMSDFTSRLNNLGEDSVVAN